MRPMRIVFLLGLIACLFACAACDSKDAGPAFWTAASAAVAAIPVVGPVLAPVVATAGPALTALAGTHGTALLAGGAIVHHQHFGLPLTSRRKHLASARQAHAAAVAKLKAPVAAAPPAPPPTTTVAS